ncbi:MAG: hypothetical protein J7K65_03290 [Planctomycetes bacterium]|nr:hypothetical protein [Planctomycetota bacterium]
MTFSYYEYSGNVFDADMKRMEADPAYSKMVEHCANLAKFRLIVHKKMNGG